MNKEDMMRLLNLKPTSPTKGEQQQLFSPVHEDGGDSPPSENAIANLDEWDHERGRAIKKLARLDLPEEAIADFHGVAYLTDPESQPCIDGRRGEFVKTLLETPECQSLRSSTVLHGMASEMAAVQFARSFAELVKDDQQRKENCKGKGKPSDQQKQAMQDQMACLRAAGRAIDQATKEVEEMTDMMSAMGIGHGGGSDGQIDTKKVANIFHRIKDNHMLRKIINLAGRFRRVAQSKQRSKISHGYDDMIGVVMDGDVSRLLPHELAQLADPDFELDAMRRLVERQSMCREYRGVEKVGKGPIVVCVDESGSMTGDPICQAKGFALAMAWVARHQNRYLVLVGYSGGREGTFCVLPPRKWDEGKLMDWLSHFYSGGTDMDVPLEIVPQKWDSLGVPKGKTDLILLTDGIVSIPDPMRKGFLAWKELEKVRTISLILNSHAGQLPTVSDETHLIRGISVTEAGIESCLSI